MITLSVISLSDFHCINFGDSLVQGFSTFFSLQRTKTNFLFAAHFNSKNDLKSIINYRLIMGNRSNGQFMSLQSCSTLGGNSWHTTVPDRALWLRTIAPYTTYYISGSQPFSYCGTLLTPKIVTEHVRHRKTSHRTLKAKKFK
jgi:hypothetical protein